MLTNNKTHRFLIDRLKEKKVGWRVASCGDISDIILYKRYANNAGIKSPDVFLHTDDRTMFFNEAFWDYAIKPHDLLDNSSMVADNMARVARRVTLTRVCEYERLEPIRGDLSYAIDTPNIGRIIEYRVTVTPFDGSRFTCRLIVAAVESAEFAARFLVPNGIRVSSLYAFDYKTSFNGIKFAGVWAQRVAAGLGAQFFFSDHVSISENEDSWRHLCDIYPEMSSIPEVYCNHFECADEALSECCRLAGVAVYRLGKKEGL